MAVLAITNRLLYHVETIADLIALGSDDGLTTDAVAYIEATKSWSRPQTVSATSSTWTSASGLFPEGLPNGIVFYMDAGNRASFPDSAATDIYDVIQNANSGALSGVTVTNSHLNFDGVDDNISFTKNTNLDDLFNTAGPGGTVMVWCRPDDVDSATTLVSTKGSGGNDGWSCQINSGGTPSFTHDWSTVDYTRTGNDGLRGGIWYSVTYVGDANSMGIAVNGNFQGGTGFGGTGTAADDTGNKVFIGREEDATLPFDGDIDLVLIWDRQLSVEEVKQAHDVLRNRFTRIGMTLVDTITLTSGSTSITFSGLNGELDGTYYLTGRMSFAASNPFVEVRPNGATTLIGSESVGAGSLLGSSTGWAIAGWAIPEGATPPGGAKVDLWIYPELQKAGTPQNRSAYRYFTGLSTVLPSADPPASTASVLYQIGGFWSDASTVITSLDIVATAGTMEAGTSFSLYKIEDAG
jgi:hypothetical protein